MQIVSAHAAADELAIGEKWTQLQISLNRKDNGSPGKHCIGFKENVSRSWRLYSCWEKVTRIWQKISIPWGMTSGAGFTHENDSQAILILKPKEKEHVTTMVENPWLSGLIVTVDAVPFIPLLKSRYILKNLKNSGDFHQFLMDLYFIWTEEEILMQQLFGEFFKGAVKYRTVGWRE